jgi:hypothetical protein
MYRRPLAITLAIAVGTQQGLSLANNPANTKGDSIPLSAVNLNITASNSVATQYIQVIDPTTDASNPVLPLGGLTAREKSS